MFSRGLVEETESLIARFGPHCRPFTSLGYAEASAVLRGEITQTEAIQKAQQGHRNYAKRQMTWFRQEAERHPVQWLTGSGDAPETLNDALFHVRSFLAKTTETISAT